MIVKDARNPRGRDEGPVNLTEGRIIMLRSIGNTMPGDPIPWRDQLDRTARQDLILRQERAEHRANLAREARLIRLAEREAQRVIRERRKIEAHKARQARSEALQAERQALGAARTGPIARVAECHPERRHVAGGLCRPCYNGRWKKAKKAA